MIVKECNNNNYQEDLTPGQISKICNVAIRTVRMWFDSGKLGGYRLIETKERRIPVSNLQLFIKSHHLPFNISGFGE